MARLLPRYYLLEEKKNKNKIKKENKEEENLLFYVDFETTNIILRGLGERA